VRAVRNVKRPGGEVAKLFAKHFKVADQVKYLQKTRVAVAVGTPGRVAKLLENGKWSEVDTVLISQARSRSRTRPWFSSTSGTVTAVSAKSGWTRLRCDDPSADNPSAPTL